MADRNNLLDDVEAFLARHKNSGMSPYRLGREALNDSAFVYRLRKGNDYRFKTEQRVRAFMAAYDAAPDPVWSPADIGAE